MIIFIKVINLSNFKTKNFSDFLANDIDFIKEICDISFHTKYVLNRFEVVRIFTEKIYLIHIEKGFLERGIFMSCKKGQDERLKEKISYYSYTLNVIF